jgi:putative transcriptional regulator
MASEVKKMEHRIEFRIDEVLQQREQSLYWLSRTTGISYTTLWRLNKDRALGINFATLEKMCVALECQPGDLMGLGKVKQGAARKRLASTRAVRRTSSLL